MRETPKIEFCYGQRELASLIGAELSEGSCPPVIYFCQRLILPFPQLLLHFYFVCLDPRKILRNPFKMDLLKKWFLIGSNTSMTLFGQNILLAQ